MQNENKDQKEQQLDHSISYNSYLQVDSLISLQKMVGSGIGNAHDEMLFIIVHQIFELWFKQIDHDLTSIIDIFGQTYTDDTLLPRIAQRLDRIIEIEKLMQQQLNILETMTPYDFMAFRNFLGTSSGFQSAQFRIFEAKLGIPMHINPYNTDQVYLKSLNDKHQNLLESVMNGPNLFSVVEKWMERFPFIEFKNFNFWETYTNILNKYLDKQLQNADHLNDGKHKDEITRQKEFFQCLFDQKKYDDYCEKTKRRLSRKATLVGIFFSLYHDLPLLHMPSKILQKIIDLDEHLSTWRFRHAMLAHRMIGTKIGTGGSNGVEYLTQVVQQRRAFKDFFDFATFLVPPYELIELPKEIQDELSFSFSQKSKI